MNVQRPTPYFQNMRRTGYQHWKLDIERGRSRFESQKAQKIAPPSRSGHSAELAQGNASTIKTERILLRLFAGISSATFAGILLRFLR